MKISQVWKDIPNYEGVYQVSGSGEVRSLDRYVNSKNNSKRLLKGRALVKHKNNKGYITVCLKFNNYQKTWTVHKLVAMAFLNHIPNKTNKVVDHINHDRTDNKISNLRVVTQRENLSNRKQKGSSKYTGVSWCKSCEKWVSSISIRGKKKTLGRFREEYKAHLKYQEKLKEIQNENRY